MPASFGDRARVTEASTAPASAIWRETSCDARVKLLMWSTRSTRAFAVATLLGLEGRFASSALSDAVAVSSAARSRARFQST
jgi:hypothetical protein